MIKILDLNLWRYNDFENRLKNFLKVIKIKNPDVVFLQEVQIDTSISFFSQVEIIKKKLDKKLGYRYTLHSTISLKDHQSGKKLKIPIQHGMAILSKHPILNSFEYYLQKNTSELEPRSILCFDLEINNEIHKFANIHFANNEKLAKVQLKEFLNFLVKRKEKRILVGDFNMFKLSNYFKKNKNSLFSEYNLSNDFKKYISYKKDSGTLDYILLPKKYYFNELVCLEEYLSDHNGLYIEIKNLT
ncbi:MAG: endonuclease/exonuclease/phosphatase family protein [Patescibacteria group bacterium]